MPLSLPSFTIAPDATGRGYELKESHGLRGRWIVDLPMVMLAWSQLQHKAPFACCFDLGDEGLIVCRGQFVRELDTGNSVAVLAGVAVSNEQFEAIDWRTDLVALSIPLQSEGTQFWMEPHAFDAIKQQAGKTDWTQFQLGWNRRFLKVQSGTDRLSILTKFFTSIEPPQQIGWLRSWSTTDTLPAKGGLDLNSQAQLLMGDAQAEEPKGYLTASVAAQAQEGKAMQYMMNDVAASKLPPIYQAFLDMNALAASVLSSAEQQRPDVWSRKYTTTKAEGLMRKLALGRAERSSLPQTYKLLEAMLDHPNVFLRTGGQSAVLLVLERLNSRGVWAPDTLPLIQKLPDTGAVFELLTRGQELKYYNTELLAGLAKIATSALAKRELKGVQELVDVSKFAVEFAHVAKEEASQVDIALSLVQVLINDSYDGGIREVLTSGTVAAFADHNIAKFRKLAGNLIDGKFLDVTEFLDTDHAMTRIGAAVLSIERLVGQHG